MSEFIKRCPFCNGEAKTYSYDPYDSYQGNCSTGRVECRNCGAMVEAKTLKKAIEKWNRRFIDMFRLEGDI